MNYNNNSWVGTTRNIHTQCPGRLMILWSCAELRMKAVWWLDMALATDTVTTWGTTSSFVYLTTSATQLELETGWSVKIIFRFSGTETFLEFVYVVCVFWKFSASMEATHSNFQRIYCSVCTSCAVLLWRRPLNHPPHTLYGLTGHFIERKHFDSSLESLYEVFLSDSSRRYYARRYSFGIYAHSTEHTAPTLSVCYRCAIRNDFLRFLFVSAKNNTEYGQRCCCVSVKIVLEFNWNLLQNDTHNTKHKFGNRTEPKQLWPHQGNQARIQLISLRAQFMRRTIEIVDTFGCGWGANCTSLITASTT